MSAPDEFWGRLSAESRAAMEARDTRIAELRARAEKAEAVTRDTVMQFYATVDRAVAAEAERDREFESGNDWCIRALAAEAERDRLRDGIQALADSAENGQLVNYGRGDYAYIHGRYEDALRGLLSPTPEGPKP